MFRFTFLSLCLLNLCAGFAPPVPPSRTATWSSTEVALSTLYLDDDDLRYRQMISKARECAFSDDAGSPVDARMFLREILRLESGCVSGNLSGAICDNVAEVADIVAHLRQKANQEASGAVPTSLEAAASGGGLVSSTLLVMFAAATAALLYTTIDFGTGATPYQMQEWVWAARGGYLDDMIRHFVRNSGL